MLKEKAVLSFLFFVSVLCFGIFGLPQSVNAQTNKDQNQVKQEREDDDNDADEKISSEDAKKVKFTLDQARAIALKKISGTVLDEELEKEKGRLQYAFDIRAADGKIYDVEIDAITGKVLQAVIDDEEDDDN